MPGLLQSAAFGSRKYAALVFVAAALTGLWATGLAPSVCASSSPARLTITPCSQYASDSPEVRQCMRAAGEKLSPRCLNALIAEGEVSEEEVARRAALLRQ